MQQVQNIVACTVNDLYPQYKKKLDARNPSRIQDEAEDKRILIKSVVRRFYEMHYYPKLHPDVFKMEETIYKSK